MPAPDIESTILSYLEARKSGSTMLEVRFAIRHRFAMRVAGPAPTPPPDESTIIECVNRLIRVGKIRVERPRPVTARFIPNGGPLKPVKSTGIKLYYVGVLEQIALASDENAVTVEFLDTDRWRYTTLESGENDG